MNENLVEKSYIDLSIRYTRFNIVDLLFMQNTFKSRFVAYASTLTFSSLYVYCVL